MKTSYLFAATLITALAFASNANAAPVTVDSLPYNLNTITSASPPVSVSTPTSGQTFYNYTASGFLAADTSITFNYTATNVVPSYIQLSDGTLGANNTSLSFTDPSTSASAGSLPVLVTANFNAGTLSGKVVIENLGAVAQNFSTYFTSLLTQNSDGVTTVGYSSAAISPVPLPPAAFLFLTGLFALVGFGIHRKVRA